MDRRGLRDTIVCENDLGFYFGDMHPWEGPLAPITAQAAEKIEKSNKRLYSGYSTSNQNWSIDPDGRIRWRTTKPGPPPSYKNEVHFSRIIGGQQNQFYAEVCSGLNHPDAPVFKPGEARIWVRASSSSRQREEYRRFST